MTQTARMQKMPQNLNPALVKKALLTRKLQKVLMAQRLIMRTRRLQIMMSCDMVWQFYPDVKTQTICSNQLLLLPKAFLVRAKSVLMEADYLFLELGSFANNFRLWDKLAKRVPRLDYKLLAWAVDGIFMSQFQLS